MATTAMDQIQQRHQRKAVRYQGPNLQLQGQIKLAQPQPITTIDPGEDNTYRNLQHRGSPGISLDGPTIAAPRPGGA